MKGILNAENMEFIHFHFFFFRVHVVEALF